MENPYKVLSQDDAELLKKLVLLERHRKNMTAEEMQEFHRMVHRLADRCPVDKEGRDAWFAEAALIREQVNQDHPT